ncbi:hypothetical protein GN244_ATG19604 [Phytophthora infestans]|uniref:Uncharacterized protein n=1 Tax=Phytophthora infestans TaxID=4787 RepID=A0A833SIW9_PHYIN|nr:hypothetical protein GN244_ATG19604 [Phytophthora infestans]
MATEMTTTEETENDGDSDERGRESLGTRRREWRRGPAVWLNAVATLCHLAVRVARARDRASRQPRRPRRRRRFVEVTSEDVRALAREDVSGDVARSVAERGGYAVSSGCTSGAGTGSSKQTTETSEETETFCRVTSEDVRALAREDVSGDVTRSVAERGGYAVSSGCTSGAGTGSSKQTTETSEETETFCRGTTTEIATEMTRRRKRKTTETVTSEDVRALAREDVSGDVTRSVAERGGYAVSSGCTSGAGTGSSKQTTETSEETETFCRVTSEDVRAAREDVSGDVTRSVAERGGYAVSSGCTSGAGTGSSKQTTETSEETETFCRGYHYGNGHRDDHDGGNGKRRRQ